MAKDWQKWFPEDWQRLQEAEDWARKKHAGQSRKSGEEFINHPIAVAQILAAADLGSDTVLAALLHDTIEDTDATQEEIRELWGDEVANMVWGITKVERATEREAQAATYRKLLLAAADDARVLLIKIADRLHNMRTIQALAPQRRLLVAEETLRVYAPIAHRLGLSQMKEELEDRALAVLDPQAYREAATLQDQRKRSGAKEMKRLLGKLRRLLKKNGIEAKKLSSRVKSRYSIAEKMSRREGAEVWDILGIRIIVPSRDDCYRTLGLVHELWPPLPEQFDDYIAVPRGNLYQSLHTTVMTDAGHPVEIQIRTPEMDELAEHGIGAHWLYKEQLRHGGPRGTKEYIAASAAGVEDTRQELEELFLSLRADTFSDEMYVFTPAGDIRILPTGATAIDFAYSVHTDLGHSISGARVDGKLYPITKPLPAGSQIEITRHRESSPSPDWLDHVKTSKARNRIRASLASKRDSVKTEEGLERIANSLKEQGAAPLAEGENLQKSLARAGYSDMQEVSQRALRNKSLLREIVRDVVRASGKKTEPAKRKRGRPQEEPEVEIEGMGGVMVRLAGCCNPAPGQRVVGYVSIGRGVSLHKASCHSVKEWQRTSPERLVAARWDDESVLHHCGVRFRYRSEAGQIEKIASAVTLSGGEVDDMKISWRGSILKGEMQIRFSERRGEKLLQKELQDLPGALEIELREI